MNDSSEQFRAYLDGRLAALEAECEEIVAVLNALSDEDDFEELVKEPAPEDRASDSLVHLNARGLPALKRSRSVVLPWYAPLRSVPRSEGRTVT
jgi:hypothetical protein